MFGDAREGGVQICDIKRGVRRTPGLKGRFKNQAEQKMQGQVTET
jgi:hypothetical protein